MSGLASHGRGMTSGVLRRTVSNPAGIAPGILNEVMQRSDGMEICRNIRIRSDADNTRHQVSGLLDDMSSLERVVTSMEEDYNTSKRLLNAMNEVADAAPRLQSPRNVVPGTATSRHDQKEFMGSLQHVCPDDSARCSTAANVDGPVYSAYLRELSVIKSDGVADRRVCEERHSRSSTPSPTPSGCSSAKANHQAHMQMQFDEVRASNKMLQRALVAVQRRLRAVETERDQLRAERDRFRGVLCATLW
eukprot:CAMPEP_0113724040 /NCGR_PEP_ID=MMETSP0038_2-20120614/38819_1 /TAXON_ID=2898 /ORGANISM="Cryptomonas paramecium" /LENGTH=247 /DNA_ID=CAMNT_0000653819 /DNA_START=66 /DNA_END=809 /DNA_ORIENTATION=- /assembly_acc=CAM_ASM_000170